MFDSISKVWNEVAETSDAEHSVRFSPSTRAHNSSNKTRYIQQDRLRGSILKSPLDRVRNTQSSLTVRGSPRILKPTSDARQQRLNSQSNKATGIWGALGKLGKVFKPDTSEIGSMKDYMNGMIPVNESSAHGIKRPAELAKSRLESIKHRAQLVNQRAARFASENLSPEKKRQRTTSLQHEPVQIRRIQLKDLEDLESSRDNIAEKVHRRRARTTVDQRTPRPTSLRHPSSATANATNVLKFNINDIPSSPMRGNAAPVATGTPAIYNDTTTDSVNVSQATLNNLTKKLQLLENTVESLKEELKVSNERSQHLEVTLNEVKREQETIDNTILKSEEMDKIELYEPQAHASPRESTPSVGQYENRTVLAPPGPNSSVKRTKSVQVEEEDEFEEVNRSLSPVKLDLRKFKYIE